MGWPKHTYAWIVIHGMDGKPIRVDGPSEIGHSSGFAEVFLDQRVANWIRDEHRKVFSRLAMVNAQDNRAAWLDYRSKTRTIRIALPGTYPQIQWDALKKEFPRR